MIPDIYVVDIETTSLTYENGTEVVEIGCARLHMESDGAASVYPELSLIVHQDLEDEDAWVFQNTTLTPEDVRNSPWAESHPWRADVTGIVRHYLRAKWVTSYNRAFDFDGFLFKYPWALGNDVRLLPCIMQTACSFLGVTHCRAQEAYDVMFPDSNPAGLPDHVEEHRALSDAVAEAHILRYMMQNSDGIREAFLYADVLSPERRQELIER